MIVSDKDDSGFGTLEALVAFLILSIMLGGAVQLISGSASLLKRSQELNNSRLLLDRVSAMVLPSLDTDRTRLGKAQNGYRLTIEALSETDTDTSPTGAGRLVAVRVQTQDQRADEFLTFRFIDSDAGE